MGCSNSTPKESPAARDRVVLEGDFKVSIERSDDAEMFGVFMEQHEETYAKITQIEPSGLIQAWNQRHENTPEFQLKPGDIIVSFNGISGPLSTTKKELKKKTITLWVKRATSDNVTEASHAAEPAAEPVGASEDATAGAAVAAVAGAVVAATAGAAEDATAGAAEDATTGASEDATAGVAADATVGASEDATAGASEDATAGAVEDATESAAQDRAACAAKEGASAAAGAGDATVEKTPRLSGEDAGNIVVVDLEASPQEDPKSKPCFFCGVGV